MKPNLKNRRWTAINKDPYFVKEKQVKYHAAMKHGFNPEYCSSGYKKFTPEEIAAYESTLKSD